MGQISFPTLAGWFLVFAPTLAYSVFTFGVLCYYYIPQYGFKSQNVFEECLFLTLLAFLCYHLTRIARHSFAASKLD